MAQLREPLRTRGDEIMNKEYRQVIHFAAIPEVENYYGRLFAVLEDGTVYCCVLEPDNECWTLLPPVPETEAAAIEDI